MEKNNFENFNLGESIIEGLEQAVAYEEGDKTKAREIVRAVPVPQYTPEMIAALRKRKGMTQASLAIALNVSKRSIEAWETGRYAPNGAANKMLYLLDRDDDMLDRLMSG